jgi:hypothetical protein
MRLVPTYFGGTLLARIAYDMYFGATAPRAPSPALGAIHRHNMHGVQYYLTDAQERPFTFFDGSLLASGLLLIVVVWLARRRGLDE